MKYWKSLIYCYLGIQISANGSFNLAVKHLCDKAIKAAAKLKQIIWNTGIDITIALKLFEKLITPILLYACEAWGPFIVKSEKCFSGDISNHTSYSFEKIHLNYLKFCLGVNKKASNFAVLSELGQYPLTLNTFTQMSKYWFRIVKLNPDLLLYGE